MTYCVGLWLKDGMVFLSDTRTNAGVDNISIFSKMHLFQIPGERFITLLTGGNLAVAQAVVNLLHEGIKTEERVETLYTVPTMFRAAQLVGARRRRPLHAGIRGRTLEPGEARGPRRPSGHSNRRAGAARHRLAHPHPARQFE